MKKISAKELYDWRTNKVEHQLVDVREDHEISYSNIGGEHIPMSEIIDHQLRINRNIPVVIHCRTGKRSKAVVMTLERKFGFENLYSLDGGIVAWAEQIDNSLKVY
jgi:rhodanese-related sulfurtransferase